MINAVLSCDDVSANMYHRSNSIQCTDYITDDFI